MKPEVIVADDHRLVAEGVVKILEKEYNVVATPTDGRAFIEAVERFRPDLALVDISLPLLNGLDACRHVKKSCPEVKIIILTMHAEQHFVNEAFRVGVKGYVLKTSVADELLFAAKEVLNGCTYITPVVAQGLVEQSLESSTEPPRRPKTTPTVMLSLRQREVLQLVAEGKSNKEIASTINVTVKTIEFHKARISKELGVHTTAELTKQAITLGLIAPPETPQSQN
ncbi:MAG TPA: response regulator transcription factor [Nitrospiraceae bacterium]|jgi:DNA-binding NarL/FixJ family response regulator|nr:response regulator transcription factor [Nitrospiraceae bacterium]